MSTAADIGAIRAHRCARCGAITTGDPQWWLRITAECSSAFRPGRTQSITGDDELYCGAECAIRALNAMVNGTMGRLK